MIGSILGIIRGLFVFLGWMKERKDQAIGAELQRGRDSADELTRVTKAVNAGSDPTLVDDSLLPTDPNNRANKRKSGSKTSGV